MGLYRIALREIISEISKNNKKFLTKKIGIYGAGEAGRQLAAPLKYSNKSLLLLE